MFNQSFLLSLGLLVSFSQSAFAQTAAAPAAAAGPSGFENMVLPLFVLGAMYFFMLRPQAKRAKQHSEFVKNLKRGDKVITNGGIYGEVYGVTEKFATIEIADNVRVRVLKSQIAGLSQEGNA